jgi:hypothetical protein
MKLRLREKGRARDGKYFYSGEINGYGVDGLPMGQEADIANFGSPTRNDWQTLRIKDGVQGHWNGHHQSADDALKALQQEIEQEL